MATSETHEKEGRLERVFEECYPAVLAYARRRTSSDAADDVAAATFAVAWRRASDVPADALPWLLGVARNVLATEKRSRERKARLEARLVETAARADDDGVVDELSGAILEALGALPERDREVLLLVAWDGLAPKHAARVIGTTTSGFYVRFHRAKRRLSRELARTYRGRSPTDAPRQVVRQPTGGET